MISRESLAKFYDRGGGESFAADRTGLILATGPHADVT
jgi:hypothetical protein